MALLFAAAPAWGAGTVTGSTSGIDYDGDGGANVVTVTDAPQGAMGSRVTFTETGIVAGAGCTQQTNAAFCDTDDTSDSVFIDLAGGADRATLNGGRQRIFLSGGEGNDELTGSNLDGLSSYFESLNGNAGTDRIFGRGGNDQLGGDEGNNDLADGGAGEDSFFFDENQGSGDVVRGGPGFDDLNASWDGPDPAGGARIDLAAGTAAFAGRPAARVEQIEDANGDDGPDTLLGSPAANLLEGDEGGDVIDGRQGPDQQQGDEGNDLLAGSDGFTDFLAGGPGTDTCNADQLDTRDLCEAGTLVTVPPFGSVIGDRRAPRCTAQRVPAKPKVKGVRKSGIAFRATCDEAARLGARLVAGVRRLGRKPRFSRAGDLELGTRSVRATAGKQVRLRLRVAKRFKRYLRRRVRLRIELTAVDAAGNERVTQRRVRLR